MAERKSLNKYYAPNFNPETDRLAGGRRNATVRIMTPFSMQCTNCGEFIYKGKKFNARKELVKGEHYLNIEIFRFYIRCTCCMAEITYKTDPQHTDYIAEHGAKRNFEPWREERIINEQIKRKREEEEENNPMRALENRTNDSRREIEVMEALDEIRTTNARHEKIDLDELQKTLRKTSEEDRQEYLKKKKEQEQDEAIMKAKLSSVTRIEENSLEIKIKDEKTPKPKTRNLDLGIVLKPKTCLVDYEDSD